ncbi:Asp-tRNA(Asn)/Glu-tRNA(Gln) amidotransferase subunit GatB [Candidatus Babeliales bacterium]|nr:Asp-tRNA(Asn)/Glu-tRNA(Gln) amidotransferase subunit GatB [Candidatus Babeliales bacterium]MCF7899574.1 Asp-tRNA(Asn)/Glu-tRNA(Gln) amidotransferase subunit GatB [Candidatus Babeliales bacterium]
MIINKYPGYQACIGMEIHVQLKTESKIFCSCSNKFGDEPNQNICPICAGHPGSLPSLNKEVVDFAIMAGIATNSKISQTTTFARKHYSYPDLPKNFQITQDNLPICHDGYLIIDLPDNQTKKIRLIRIHMEEDAGKNLHATENESWVDLNRAGTPLLEIVTHPDISNSQETKAYLTQLKRIVEYLGISDANMEEGSFRGDVNISVKKKTDEKLGIKVELKNINSFKYMGQAIDYEIERQIALLESGQKIKQETRSWDSKLHKTIFMRSKGEAQDYRYFIEPDLPILQINEEWINRIKKEIPELAHEKLIRFQQEYNIANYEADILVSDINLANFFEETTKFCKNPKLACNWILRDVLGFLKEKKLDLKSSKITPNLLAELLIELDKETINSKVAQEIFLEMAEYGKSPIHIIKEKDLSQIGSIDDLEKIALEVINTNQEQVKEYLSGKDRLFGFFVGQIMKATNGKANPKILQDLLKKHLK